MQSCYYFQHDLLNREESAKIFVEEFLKKELNYVIGLNSEYGSGKTTFIKLCQDIIRKDDNKELKVVIINTAENEFENNPSFTILNAIISSLSEKEDDLQLELIARLLLDLTAKENININSDTLSIRNYLMKDRALIKKQFIQRMESFLNGRKIIVFLDDLDRCSPYFAIRILEELKYYFKFIKGITFVIAYDRMQLESFIKVKFGNDIDTNGYLAKFFDTRYILKKATKKDFITNTFEQCINKLSSSGINDDIQVGLEVIRNTICDDKELLEFLSLRDLQQLVFKIVQGFCTSTNQDTVIDVEFSQLISLLSYVRVLDWHLYMELYKQIKNIEDAIDDIKKNKCFNNVSDERLGLLIGSSETIENTKLKLAFNVLEADQKEEQ